MVAAYRYPHACTSLCPSRRELNAYPVKHILHQRAYQSPHILLPRPRSSLRHAAVTSTGPHSIFRTSPSSICARRQPSVDVSSCGITLLSSLSVSCDPGSARQVLFRCLIRDVRDLPPAQVTARTLASAVPSRSVGDLSVLRQF
ncbi:hypothetical protein PYCCODRAFT_403513 [Trametes coccinea BRFM310]|uniref:Uncharacterized protein n=1 Tax=Trametes coccinea (strain BRFM310) TaxID=1353009 RepID=A0A1Y2IMW2_TRAC3|nr:hypothetical protein PYCCODRAFT_403513 [Trametes coccinea BRFM310]